MFDESTVATAGLYRLMVSLYLVALQAKHSVSCDHTSIPRKAAAISHVNTEILQPAFWMFHWHY
jgi:hypothetical protein